LIDHQESAAGQSRMASERGPGDSQVTRRKRQRTGKNCLPDSRQVDVPEVSDGAADQDQTGVEEVDDSGGSITDELSGGGHEISHDWVAVSQSIADIGQRH
jgi:hypothetical protein